MTLLWYHLKLVCRFLLREEHIPNGNCCKSHIIKRKLYEEDINHLRIYSYTSIFEVSELEKLLDQLAINSDSMIMDKIGDYSFCQKNGLLCSQVLRGKIF